MKYGIRDNAELRRKKLDSPWDGRTRNNENLVHGSGAGEKKRFRWVGFGPERSEISAYLSLCDRNSLLDVAAPKKK